MMYGILLVAFLFIIFNLPKYIRRQLTEQLANESSKARDNLQLSQLNFLSKIEWLRFYPLKKLLLGALWLICLFIAIRGIFITINDPRKAFIVLTSLFWIITFFTARKIWRYIRLPYHSVPILNHIKTKDELKESLQGECFEKVIFKHKILSKYFHVLISDNWVIIDGYLIPRNGIQKIYYLHESPVWNYEQIRLIYSNGEEFRFPSDRQTANELRQKEISNLLHKISPVVIEKAEEANTSSKKDQSIIYCNMNYKGKFRRTLWFIPIVIILCFLTPIFMGRFWFIYDIILVVVLILQLRYTYKMMKLEELSKESNESKSSTYVIEMKNVHMYCYNLTIKDDKNTYEAIIEAAPTKQKTMIIWLEDFNLPKNEIDSIKKEIENFFVLKDTICIFESGKRV